MKIRTLALSLSAALVVLFTLTAFSNAQQETILMDLTLQGGAGGDPAAGLFRDSQGNLYGTTAFGGTRSGGTVFQLLPQADGTWARKVLYPFIEGIHDGQSPRGSVIFDSAGNLYCTTYWGGLTGQGTVFELMPERRGQWKEKQLHSFGVVPQDGLNPRAGVIFDPAGNLYGTTTVGGGHNLGTVFELSPQPNGTWSEKILHTFKEDGTDGYDVEGGLVMDSAGNLYGTTAIGGTPPGYGIVFELSPTKYGPWKETILHSFVQDGVDGVFPNATLIFDAAGNLYGTTAQGGTDAWGTAFELSPNADGTWTESILHNFNNVSSDGANPYGALVFDAAGNLYGTTEAGGPYSVGTVFKLTPAAGGGWTETVLYNFGSQSNDGMYPLDSLILDPAGNLYGTTDEGGTTGYGTVFEITP